MPKFCGNCGKSVKPEGKFCVFCGKKIVYKDVGHAIVENDQLKDTIKEFQSGNRSMFQNVCALSNLYLYSSIMCLINNQEITMIIMKEVYIKVYNKLLTNYNPENPMEWMIVIAYKLCLQNFKSESPNPLQLDCENLDVTYNSNNFLLPEDAMESVESQKIVKNLIKDLNQIERLIFICFYYHSMKIDKIVEMFELPREEVDKTLKSARLKIDRGVKSEGNKKGFKLNIMAATPFFALVFGKEVQASTLSKEVIEPIKDVIDRLLLGIEELVKTQPSMGESNTTQTSGNGEIASKNAKGNTGGSKQKKLASEESSEISTKSIEEQNLNQDIEQKANKGT